MLGLLKRGGVAALAGLVVMALPASSDSLDTSTLDAPVPVLGEDEASVAVTRTDMHTTAYSPTSVAHCHTSGCKPCGPYYDDGEATWTGYVAHGGCPKYGYGGSVAHWVSNTGYHNYGSKPRISIDGRCRVIEDHGGDHSGDDTWWIDIFHKNRSDAINYGHRHGRTGTWPSSC